MMTTWHFFLSIKIYYASDGTLADRAEVVRSVGAHAAVVCRAVDALRLVAGSFEQLRLTGIEHILPLRFEISQSCDVLLPWFDAWIVKLDILVIVEIFIGQTGEAVSEFVHNYRSESWMMSCGQSV